MYHPEFDQLVEYASGCLHPSINLCISTHIDFCHECKVSLSKLETLGGALLEAAEDLPVSPHLLTHIFAHIDAQQSSYAAHISTTIINRNNLPTSINKLINYDTHNLHWRRHGQKVRSAEMLNHDGIKASLVYISAGATIPEHKHTGLEYTVVLEGSFSDIHGVYQQGDFLLRKEGEPHSPTATADKDCLCLTVLEAPLKFHNPLYEIFNRLVPL